MMDFEARKRSIWHAFNALDEQGTGQVAKSKLKVLSHNLGQVVGVEGLDKVLDDNEEKTTDVLVAEAVVNHIGEGVENEYNGDDTMNEDQDEVKDKNTDGVHVEEDQNDLNKEDKTVEDIIKTPGNTEEKDTDNVNVPDDYEFAKSVDNPLTDIDKIDIPDETEGKNSFTFPEYIEILKNSLFDKLQTQANEPPRQHHQHHQHQVQLQPVRPPRRGQSNTKTSMSPSNHVPATDIASKLDLLDDVCWMLCGKPYLGRPNQNLDRGQAQKLWNLFNFLVEVDEADNLILPLVIDREEAEFLCKAAKEACGQTWDKQRCDALLQDIDSCDFRSFLDLFERNCLQGLNNAEVGEAMDELYNHVMNDVLKAGFLCKKGHVITNSKDRWFILNTHTLRYYTGPDKRDMKGDIKLTPNCKVEPVKDRLGNKSYRFNLNSEMKKFEITAPDLKTKNEWVAALNKAISHCTQTVSLQKQAAQNRQRNRKMERRKQREKEDRLRAEQEHLQKQSFQLESEKEARAKAEALLQQEARRREEERMRLEALERARLDLEARLREEEKARKKEAHCRNLEHMTRVEVERQLEEEAEMRETERRRLEEFEAARKALETQLLADLDRIKLEGEVALEACELKRQDELQKARNELEARLEEELAKARALAISRQQAEEAMREAELKRLEDVERMRKELEDRLHEESKARAQEEKFLSQEKEARANAEARLQAEAKQREEDLRKLKELEDIKKDLQERLEAEELVRMADENTLQLEKQAREELESRLKQEAELRLAEQKRLEELDASRRELQALLQEEMQAREDEAMVRALQARILDEEFEKREQLEEIHRKQEELLSMERRKREGLEGERQKQEDQLLKAQEQLAMLQQSRIVADNQLSDALEKLKEADSEKAKLQYKIKLHSAPIGLARPIQPHVAPLVTHRGYGAFTTADFVKRPSVSSKSQLDEEDNLSGVESVKETENS